MIGAILGAVSLGKGIYDSIKGGQRASKDQKQARKYAQQVSDVVNKALQQAQTQYNLNSPLREAFRMGALNFSNPYNPFSRNLVGGYADQLQSESAPPEPRTAKPRQGTTPGTPGATYTNGGITKMDQLQASPLMAMAKMPSNSPMAQGPQGDTAQNAMAGTLLGGRVPGQPVMRGASQKGGLAQLLGLDQAQGRMM